jgi:hypothetical protein
MLLVVSSPPPPSDALISNDIQFGVMSGKLVFLIDSNYIQNRYKNIDQWDNSSWVVLGLVSIPKDLVGSSLIG